MIGEGAVYQLLFLEEEHSIGTWYSVLGLFCAAAVLALIAIAEFARRSKWAPHWALLALLFVAMSMDESVSIHELSMAYLDKVIEPSGLLYFTWVVPGTALVLLVAFFYRSFVMALPGRYALLFSVAAATFVFGALIAEYMQAWLASTYGNHGPEVAFQILLQDPFGMLGVAILISALLSYCVNVLGVQQVSFGPSETAGPRVSNSSSQPFLAPLQNYRLDPVSDALYAEDTPKSGLKSGRLG